MSNRKSPLRDRLLSNSPDPIKSSIMRDSGMGWISPTSNHDSTSSGSSGSITSPLRIAKRDSPRILPQPQLARRSSSSYKHVRDNNLVSKSPFKSQIPTPLSTPSRHAPISFPLPRRISGEKRPRPSSMYEQAEDENERPFAFKRERRQSKGYQGLIQKEPVTKSPFKQRTPSAEEQSSLPLPPPPLTHLLPRVPTSSTSSAHSSTSLVSVSVPIVNTGASPARSSLVSRRMHGPRLSNGGGRKRERRKTVTFDERCDVVEFDREEDTDEDVFSNMDEDDDYEIPPKHSLQQDDPFLGNNEPCTDVFTEERGDSSYESIQLSDISDGGTRGPSLLGMTLDADANISGLVDEMFSSSSVVVIDDPDPDSSLPLNTAQPFGSTTVTSTPTREKDNYNLPAELETEDGIPLGRSHHTARFLQHHHQRSQSPQSPPRFLHQQQPLPAQYLPEGSLTLLGHASPHGPPATPPRRSLIPSAATTYQLRTITECPDDSTTVVKAPSLPSNDDPTPLDASSAHLSTPPLGRSTHIERVKKAREEECDDVLMLPGSPSPSKSGRKPGTKSSLDKGEGLIPRFEIEIEQSSISTISNGEDSDPFILPSQKHEPPPLDEVPTGEPIRSANSLADESKVEPSGRGGDSDSHMKEQNTSFFTGVGSNGSPPRGSTGHNSQTLVSAEGRHSNMHSLSLEFHANSESESHSNGSDGRRRISREDIKSRLLDRRGSPNSPDVEYETTPLGEYEQDDRDALSVITSTTDISTELAVIGQAEKKTLTSAGEVKEFSLLEVGEGLRFDLGSEFRIGGLDLEGLSYGVEKNSVDKVERKDEGMGEVSVDVDMRSALDRLMDDVAGAQADNSMMTDEGDSYEQQHSASPLDSTVAQRAARDSTLLHNNGFTSRNPSASSFQTIPPPVPPKDNIRSREKMIIEKRREARRIEADEDLESYTSSNMGGKSRRGQELLGMGRPSRRRSMSTGDADLFNGTSKKRSGIHLDVGSVGEVEAQAEHLAESIEKELQKLEEVPQKHTTKYLVREREGTIYASSSDPDTVSHMAGPGDVNAGKAWRAVRRPSDMNEYSKQIKEYRAQEKPGKAYGKVFVKVLGIKGIHIPLPQQPTVLTCTLNNGIHFVTTPECQLGRESRIDQEFELIEHSKLEFTLTLKIRRDQHIMAQFKALTPPTPTPPTPAPPLITQTSSKGGMRSFFSSSPKKSSKDKLPVQPPAPPPPNHRLPENLARYLKPDGTLARAFISFKDIASRCDARLLETSYPLIGQRIELAGKFSTLQVGEIVLQMFRLPPLPGIAPQKLPQSLEECHRGLRHINWHKVTYFEGTLTQSGGDCSTWRRRQLRVIGANLVAFNDVTKKATATIDLKKAIAIEDDQEAHKNTLSPASGATHSSRYDDYDGLYGVERSFRLIFPQEQEIVFFADTDEEKARWLHVLRALVGHIPPHPLWAELLWQRQEDLSREAGSLGVPRPSTQSSPSWLISRRPQR